MRERDERRLLGWAVLVFLWIAPAGFGFAVAGPESVFGYFWAILYVAASSVAFVWWQARRHRR